MFVRDFVQVARPMGLVGPRFLDGADEWLTPLANRAVETGRSLRDQLETGSPSCSGPCDVALTIGAARRRDDAILLPMAWAGTSESSTFPSLMADLEVAPVGATRTHISFSGTYEARREGLGRRGDELLFHRYTEASVRQFLVDIAQSLEAPGTS